MPRRGCRGGQRSCRAGPAPSFPAPPHIPEYEGNPQKRIAAAILEHELDSRNVKKESNAPGARNLTEIQGFSTKRTRIPPAAPAQERHARDEDWAGGESERECVRERREREARERHRTGYEPLDQCHSDIGH